MERNAKLFTELFLSTLKISAFTFGGGYVIVPLMRKRFVEELNWIDEQEMLDLISVSQSAPGPLAVNAALMVGYRMAGIPGAFITALGTTLPPLLIISVVSFFYRQFRDNAYVNAVMNGMQAGVAAVICNVVLDLGHGVLKSRSPLSILVMTGVFAAVYFFRVNILWVIFLCALLGLASGMIRARRSMFQIGLFSIGGGYVAIPLIQEQIVTLHGWLSLTEFTDIITIAEMTPGPIALNAATFVGMRVAGIPGALTATVGCILAPCVIVLLLAKLYYKYRNLNAMQYILSGLRPAVVAMIASAGVSIVLLAFFANGVFPHVVGDVHFLSIGIFALGLLVLKKWKVSPLYVMGGSGLIGLIVYLFLGV